MGELRTNGRNPFESGDKGGDYKPPLTFSDVMTPVITERSPKAERNVESAVAAIKPQSVRMNSELAKDTSPLENARTFPEMVPLLRAQECLVDNSRDVKTRFLEARKLFDQAMSMTAREGEHPVRAEDLRKAISELEVKIEAPRKAEPFRVSFTEEERKDIQQLQILKERVHNISLIRLQYALALNQYGYEQNDNEAKQKSIEVLKSIEGVDKISYAQSAEIQGALYHAQAGRQINLSRAVAAVLTNAAASRVGEAESIMDTGAAEILFPGLSPATPLTAALRPLGKTPSDIPLVGSVLFTNHKRSEDVVLRQLSQAYLSDATVTQRAVDLQVAAGRGALREIGSDGAAIAAGLGTRALVGRYGASTVAKFGIPGKVAAVGLPFVVAGLTKDVVNHGEISTPTEWLRGGGMYGGSLLLVRGLALNPSKQMLTEATAEKLGTRFGLEGISGTTGSLSQRMLCTEASGSFMQRAAQYGNPVNYTGFGWQGGLRYVGFGGERTACYLAEGNMNFAQFNARRVIGSVAGDFGTAYAFGAGREGLYIGTGQKMSDGTSYTGESALLQMNSAGLRAGVTASILMPIMADGARIVPGVNDALSGTGRFATKLAPSLAPEIGGIARAGSASALTQLDSFNNANRIQDLSIQARKLADEAREAARRDQEKKVPNAR